MTLIIPPVESLLDAVHVVSLPLAVPFRGLQARETALIEGPSGWGEFAAFTDYSPKEAAPWLRSALEAAWGSWPRPERFRVPVNATVPAVAADEVAQVLERFDGFHAVKVKVAQAGQRLSDDINRMAAVREVVGPHLPIRVDANGAWSVNEALEAIPALHRYTLDYVEQPCASIPELAQVRLSLARAGVTVPIAADESVRLESDPLEVARAGAADLLVIKAAPLGGVERALEIVAESGMPAVVSSALESSVGMATGIQLAACLPQLPFACGLATTGLFTGDVTRAPRRAVGGEVSIGRIFADRQLLARHAASPDRVYWWRERLRQAHHHLM